MVNKDRILICKRLLIFLNKIKVNNSSNRHNNSKHKDRILSLLIINHLDHQLNNNHVNNLNQFIQTFLYHKVIIINNKISLWLQTWELIFRIFNKLFRTKIHNNKLKPLTLQILFTFQITLYKIMLPRLIIEASIWIFEHKPKINKKSYS